MDKLKLKTENFTNKKIEDLEKLFPEVITESKEKDKIVKSVDMKKFKEIVERTTNSDENETYSLDWVGKSASRRKIAESINKTLRPVVDESVDFEKTKNVFIEGDNFEILKLLRESYLNSVKMIYIDPPYNTGKDFVYKDNFTKSREEYDVESKAVDEEGNKLFKNTATNGRFHSDWLSMMYERLTIARDLLKDDGVIFISIDDNEVANLRKICDEIFGEGNFVAHINRICTKGSKNDSTYFIPDNDFVLVYAKSLSQLKINKIKKKDLQKYPKKDEISYYKLRGLEMGGGGEDLLVNRPKMGYSIYFNSKSGDYKILHDYDLNKEPIYLKPEKSLIDKGYVCVRPSLVKNKLGRWRWSAENFMNNLTEVFIDVEKERAYTKDRKKEFLELSPNCNLEILNTQGTIELGNLFENKIFDFPKPVALLTHLISIGSNNNSNDIILDFFAGSGTTAHAVMQSNAEDGGNRRFVMVQLPEETDKDSEAYKADYKTIAEISKERIRRAGKKIQEDNKKSKEPKDLSNVDFGFKVFKVDSSNMKDVYYNPSAIDQRTLSNFKDNIKEDRTPEDLLYQVLLDMAIPLDAKVNIEKIKGKKVFVVKNPADEAWLVACFEEGVDLDLIKEIAELKPLKAVFRDSSFKSDKDKVNTEEYFKNKSSNTQLGVI